MEKEEELEEAAVEDENDQKEIVATSECVVEDEPEMKEETHAEVQEEIVEQPKEEEKVAEKLEVPNHFESQLPPIQKSVSPQTKQFLAETKKFQISAREEKLLRGSKA